MSKRSLRPVFYWLITGCVMIFIMVMLGGITRLTHSGLSMVQWNLIMGSIPPVNEVEWQARFEQYKAFPEYKEINKDYTLSDFKNIFIWEYLHRLWGRLMGLVFIIPFAMFLLRKQIVKGPLLRQCLWILAGGAAVGGIGWFMVLSGLQDKPRVSHFRLAIHLVAAFSLAAYIFNVALNVRFREMNWAALKQRHIFRRWMLILAAITLSQIIYGAFVAGLKAGLVHNTFPLMNGDFIPDAVFSMTPWWQNLVNGVSGVQFVHRMLAFAVLITGLLLFWRFRAVVGGHIKKGLTVLAVVLCCQFLLGVFTLLMRVPVYMGVLHQLGAFVLLMTEVFIWHQLVHATEND